MSTLLALAQSAADMPPSFGGDRFTFGRALFSMMATASLCLAATLNSMSNCWNERKFQPFDSPLNVNRYIIWLFCLTILIGVVPDIWVMLAWGEVSPRTMAMLVNTDREADGLVAYPVIAALLLWYRAKPVINYQLIREPIPMDLWPTFRQMLPVLKIGGLVAAMSFALAISK